MMFDPNSAKFWTGDEDVLKFLDSELTNLKISTIDRKEFIYIPRKVKM